MAQNPYEAVNGMAEEEHPLPEEDAGAEAGQAQVGNNYDEEEPSGGREGGDAVLTCEDPELR